MKHVAMGVRGFPGPCAARAAERIITFPDKTRHDHSGNGSANPPVRRVTNQNRPKPITGPREGREGDITG